MIQNQQRLLKELKKLQGMMLENKTYLMKLKE